MITYYIDIMNARCTGVEIISRTNLTTSMICFSAEELIRVNIMSKHSAQLIQKKKKKRLIFLLFEKSDL